MLPQDADVAGLLALMLFIDARRATALRKTGDRCRSPTRTARGGTGTR